MNDKADATHSENPQVHGEAVPNGAPGQSGAPGQGGAGDAQGFPDAQAAAIALAERVSELEAEKAEMKDRALRALAEAENLRRRAERDVADARAYGVTNFARDMLNVADNVRRALETVPAETRATLEGAMKSLLDGIELTERDLLKTLERHGVRKIEPLGQKFDPHQHQAMFEVPNPDLPSGQVVQVVQSGYVIGERVLRPAMVGVAKGGPKAASAHAHEENGQA